MLPATTVVTPVTAHWQVRLLALTPQRIRIESRLVSPVQARLSRLSPHCTAGSQGTGGSYVTPEMH